MRKNISLSSQVEERAKAIIKARGFDGLSDLIAALVREEFERRHPPTIVPGAPREPETISSHAEEISSARKAELAEEFQEILSYSKKPSRKKKSKTASDAPPK
jgi:hypothetical protein